jgi:heat shock protein HslJ
VPVGAVASITITGTQVAVEAGCNSGGGAVEIGDGSIAFGPIGITKMACDRGRMELERMVLGALAGTVDYTIEAGTLTLNGAAGGLILKAEG